MVVARSKTPRARGKTHLAIALSMKACQRGYRVAFTTAQQGVSRLEEAQERNSLDQELNHRGRSGSVLDATLDARACSAIRRPPTGRLDANASRRALADAGYWHKEQMEQVVSDGIVG